MNLLKKSLFLLIILSWFAYNKGDVIGSDVSSMSIALQSNGRIVVSGFATSCDKDQVTIARYLTDGTLDGTLNGVGYNMIIFGASAMGKAVTLQTDQKIVTAGYSDDTIGVLRFTTAGILDTTFGSNGRVNLNLGFNEQGNAVAMQSGKILVAGNATIGGVTQFFLTRFNSTGVLDNGFGTAGITSTPIGDGCSANAMGLQSNGKIVLAGTAVVSGQVVVGLARYSAAGVLDTTFGINGIAYTPIGNFAVGNGLIIDSNNKIVVTGFALNAGIQQIYAVRYTSNGTLDGSFGTNGVVFVDIPDTVINHGNAIALQADGNIVITGNSGNQLVVVRLNGTDGSLDTTFGGGEGYVLTSIGSAIVGNAVAIQPADQMIVVAGKTDLSAVILRYDVEGTLDTDFGGSGNGYNINPQGSAESTCGTCTVCPTGATGAGLPLTISAVSATASTNTTNTSDALMSGMTLTPTAGTYLGLFNTDCSSSADDATISASIYLNGVQLSETERSIVPRSNGANGRGLLATQAVVSPNGSEAVEVRWKVSSGTGTANNRSFHLLKTS